LHALAPLGNIPPSDLPPWLPRLSFLDLGRNWFSGEVLGEIFVFRISYLQLRKNASSDELPDSPSPTVTFRFKKDHFVAATPLAAAHHHDRTARLGETTASLQKPPRIVPETPHKVFD
jgi:hypothetical protein